jgi:Flp pilus assembly protein TadD
MTRSRRCAPALLAWALMSLLVSGCASLGLESPDSLMKEGQQLYADKKYDEAIAKFERVIQLDKTQWLAYLYLARCYIAKGTWTKALSNARLAYEAAPASDDVLPTFTRALWGGGIEAFNNGQFREAISALTEYLRLQPADASGYMALGRAYMQTGERSEALNAFLKAFQIDPRTPEVQELLRSLR